MIKILERNTPLSLDSDVVREVDNTSLYSGSAVVSFMGGRKGDEQGEILFNYNVEVSEPKPVPTHAELNAVKFDTPIESELEPAG